MHDPSSTTMPAALQAAAKPRRRSRARSLSLGACRLASGYFKLRYMTEKRKKDDV